MPTLSVRKFSDLSEVIRAAREDAELNQSELAHRLGFSRDYMSDLESGRGSLYIKRLFRVLHELGIGVTVTYSPAARRDDRQEQRGERHGDPRGEDRR